MEKFLIIAYFLSFILLFSISIISYFSSTVSKIFELDELSLIVSLIVLSFIPLVNSLIVLLLL